MSNIFKTTLLLTVMTLLFMVVGRAFGGERGMVMALIFAAIMNFISYFFSDKIALAAYRARGECLSTATTDAPSLLIPGEFRQALAVAVELTGGNPEVPAVVASGIPNVVAKRIRRKS